MVDNMIELHNCSECRFRRVCEYAGRKFNGEVCKGYIKTIDGQPWVLVPVDSINLRLVSMTGNPLL